MQKVAKTVYFSLTPDQICPAVLNYNQYQRSPKLSLFISFSVITASSKDSVSWS